VDCEFPLIARPAPTKTTDPQCRPVINYQLEFVDLTDRSGVSVDHINLGEELFDGALHPAMQGVGR
jgi:hypothetical protein